MPIGKNAIKRVADSTKKETAAKAAAEVTPAPEKTAKKPAAPKTATKATAKATTKATAPKAAKPVAKKPATPKAAPKTAAEKPVIADAFCYMGMHEIPVAHPDHSLRITVTAKMIRRCQIFLRYIT